MIDCFALFEEPRRPWLDAEALKARFVARSTEVHPDRFHSAPEQEKIEATARYAALNQAYQTLREPKERLAHLLELEQGHKPGGIEAVPPEAIESFFAVGQLCREVDAFIANRGQITSPLIKVQMFQRGMEWTERLNAQAATLKARLDLLDARLKAMNTEWELAPAPGHPERQAALPLRELEEIYRSLSFLTRWLGQFQERVVRLAV